MLWRVVLCLTYKCFIMKQIAVCVVCILYMISCENSIEVPGRLSVINLERDNVTVSSADSSVTVGVGADRITWYVLRSQTIANGENSILNNTTYKYSDDRVRDVILYRDTLEGNWFKIIKNKEGDLQVDVAQNKFPYERKLVIDVGGFLSSSESLVITQKESTSKDQGR